MVGEGYYIGAGLKFQIEISASGFDQNKDNYTIDFYCGDDHLQFTQADVFNHDGKFYLPVPTDNLQPGMLKIVTTAYVPDDDFEGGFRKEIAVNYFKFLKEI